MNGYGIVPILLDPIVGEKDGNIVGSICISKTRLHTGDGKISNVNYTELSIKIGGHVNTPEIKTSAHLMYTFENEKLTGVLYGEHVIVNTIDGERFKIIVKEEE